MASQDLSLASSFSLLFSCEFRYAYRICAFFCMHACLNWSFLLLTKSYFYLPHSLLSFYQVPFRFFLLSIFLACSLQDAWGLASLRHVSSRPSKPDLKARGPSSLAKWSHPLFNYRRGRRSWRLFHSTIQLATNCPWCSCDVLWYVSNHSSWSPCFLALPCLACTSSANEEILQ